LLILYRYHFNRLNLGEEAISNHYFILHFQYKYTLNYTGLGESEKALLSKVSYNNIVFIIDVSYKPLEVSFFYIILDGHTTVSKTSTPATLY